MAVRINSFALALFPLGATGVGLGFTATLAAIDVLNHDFNRALLLGALAGALFGGFCTCALDLALDYLLRELRSTGERG